MLPKRSILHNALLLTAIDLLLRGAAMAFQVYLSSRAGAVGLGLLQLVTAVGALAMTLGLSGARTAAMYLCAEEYGKRRFAGVRRAMELCILWGAVCSCAAAAALRLLAGTLARVWIRDARAASGLRVLALSLPLRCYVSILSGYFTASGRVRRLALVEVAEQSSSILFTFLLLLRADGAEQVCRAILLGGLAASGVSGVWLTRLLCRDFRRFGPAARGLALGKRLIRLCVPLALGDFLRSGLRTLEQLLIPLGLSQVSGSPEAAMAAYGTVHGMVFPILMFPAAILYSLSDLLLPELARCRAEGDARRIRALSERCLHLTTLFACGVAALEFLLAEPLGLLLYQSREAGMYLRLFAPLVLILYPDAIVDGMCKGLGRQVSCVRNNTITSLMDIAMLWFLLPRLGMGGYILTFAVTRAVNFYLSLQLLTDASGCRVRPVFLIKTLACGLLSAGGCLLLPEAGPLSQAGCICVLFLALYPALLTLSGALPPEEARWLRRMLLPRRGALTFCEKRRTMEKTKEVR